LLRDAIERGGIDWETNLIAALHRLSKTPERDPQDPQRYNDALRAHTAFIGRSLAPAPVLGCCDPRPALRPTRALSLDVGAAGKRQTRSRAEHSGIAKAAIDRRADEAVSG
jgi:hypothetical protein